MIRIKICGITRPQDAIAAAQAGADMIGLVFYSGSKRHVSIQMAQKIVAALPPMIGVVALFVNPSQEEVANVLANVAIDVLQFHGDEPPEFCQSFQRPYWKAIRVASQADIKNAITTYHNARALLFDACVAGAYGGTGQTFDWQLLQTPIQKPWILSGGLDSANIAAAIRQTQAIAIDVSSGVEEGAGIKDVAKMRAFIAAARQEDAA